MLSIAAVAVLLLSILPLIYGFSSLYSVVSGAPYVSSPTTLFPTILELAEPNPNRTFLELGSGIGNLLVPAAKTGMQVRGVEISPLLNVLARLRTRKFQNVQIRTGSAYDADLSTVDVVYCYLLPAMLEKFEAKFAKELQPGSMVISHAFKLPTKQPTRVIPKSAGLGATYIYTY